MIKDEDLGLVVAEDEDEEFWINIKDNTEKTIKDLKKQLKFSEAVLSLAVNHIELKEMKKDE